MKLDIINELDKIEQQLNDITTLIIKKRKQEKEGGSNISNNPQEQLAKSVSSAVNSDNPQDEQIKEDMINTSKSLAKGKVDDTIAKKVSNESYLNKIINWAKGILERILGKLKGLKDYIPQSIKGRVDKLYNKVNKFLNKVKTMGYGIKTLIYIGIVFLSVAVLSIGSRGLMVFLKELSDMWYNGQLSVAKFINAIGRLFKSIIPDKEEFTLLLVGVGMTGLGLYITSRY